MTQSETLSGNWKHILSQRTCFALGIYQKQWSMNTDLQEEITIFLTLHCAVSFIRSHRIRKDGTIVVAWETITRHIAVCGILIYGLWRNIDIDKVY